MKMLSDDDLDLADLDDQELVAAWDLWFDLAQATNEDDPPFTHGVLANVRGTAWPGRPKAGRPDDQG
jgi:hypothetical protein